MNIVKSTKSLAIAVALLIISFGASAQHQKPFFFIQMTDPQFGFFTGNKDFKKESENFEKAITAANKLRPAFVIVTGDLINLPGDAAQINEYKRIVTLLDPSIKIYHVAGNHDVTNEPKTTDIQAYRKTFGRDYYTIKHNGMYGIVLNSLYFKSPALVTQDAKAQDKWLRKELKKAQRAGASPLLVFQHHSWFLTDPAEKDEYFNIPLETRTKYLNLFDEYGVSHVFAGHYHRNSFGKSGTMEMVTTGPVGKPLGKDPSGIRIVTVKDGKASHQYYSLDAIPEHISL
jgi:3',5'-cyclic AMP phosphodiesterase CpdA